jgi:hypothetical protein
MVERNITGNNTLPINNFYNPVSGAVIPDHLSRGPVETNLASLPSGSQLLIIQGTANTSAGQSMAHYMLGTSVSGTGASKIIIANDPYSGTQVKIDAQTGQVINPPPGYKKIDFTADSYRTLTAD